MRKMILVVGVILLYRASQFEKLFEYSRNDATGS
jgi:hypothetical protein